ncbi:MAG: hypothetical protein D6719_08085 [Candidatus Dadabacteria bacterium]|nr:MAG: hypothetical protein D6719_08085 [Candidatus Dadabacteria bacterium]
MALDLGPDLGASHSILNLLNAGYQGEFASLNILTQLGSPHVKAEEVEQTKERIAKITKWLADLKKGACIFSVNWTKPETFAAQEALNYLLDLRPRLLRVSYTLAAILLDENFSERTDSIHFIIASFGRFAYSRDNYIRGFIDFGETFQYPEIVEQYRPGLKQAEEDIRIVHQVLNKYRSNPNQDKAFYEALFQMGVKLPGTFNTHAHDVLLLSAPYTGGLSYEKAGIPEEEAQIWQQMQIGPDIAGYWKSFDIHPNEAAEWGQAGCFDYLLVIEWKLRGFDAASAAGWIQAGFDPATARLWTKAGHTPQSAAENIEAGVLHPDDVGKDPIMEQLKAQYQSEKAANQDDPGENDTTDKTDEPD